MCRMTRRGFVAGCSAAIAGLAGSRFNTLAFGAESGQEVLLTVFLRGGIDGLNFMPPIGGSDRGYYEAARPSLQIPKSGTGAALPLAGQFGLHPSAAPLLELYQNGDLGFVVASGLNEANRSHFESMEFMELGTPGVATTPTGWLTRHLSTTGELPPEAIMPSLAMGDLQQASLRGDRQTINLADIGSFNLNTGPWLWRNPQRTALRQMYQADNTLVHLTGVQALDAVDVIELYVTEGYTPANGAVYPSGEFGDHLQVIAQIIKNDLGLHVVTLDLGGWDTHVSQDYWFSSLVDELSRGLHALYTDLDGAGANNFTQRLTVVVQSEFGRRLGENADDGTDHGHGNVMMVLGGHVNAGIHGPWPGLAPGQLFEGVDVAVVTDYRQVLSEVLIRRLGNNKLGILFPGYQDYQPLGVVSGTDLPPDYKGGPGTSIFSDGFESGDLSAWSNG